MFLIRRKADGFYYKTGSYVSRFVKEPEKAKFYQTRYKARNGACSVPYELWQGHPWYEVKNNIWPNLYEVIEVEVTIKEVKE